MQTTQNILELFLDSAEKYPDQIALIDKSGKALSFQELKEEVESRAAYLYKHGVRSRDQVLLCLPTDIDLYRNMLALFYLGAIAVLPQNWSDKAHLEQCCRQSDCKALIGVPKARLMAYFSKCMRSIPIKLEASSPGFRSIFPLAKVNPEQTALISFQKAEKGQYLAEKRSHSFLFHNFQTLLQLLDPQQWEIALHTSHRMTLCYLSIGNSSFVSDFSQDTFQSKDLPKLIQQLSLYKVNRFNTQPDILLKLSEHLIEEVEELKDIRRIYCEGRPLAHEEADMILEAFPRAKSQIAYGSSEASPIAIRTLESQKSKEQADKWILLGRVHDDLQIRLIEYIDEPIRIKSSEELDQLSLGGKSIGEILVKGPQVLETYYDNFASFERNKITIEDQLWHRTGDAGFLSRGELYYCGKCEDLIRHKGKIYAPILYENYLSNFKQIKRGTLLNLQGKLCLIIELKKEQYKADVMRSLTHASLSFEKIMFVKKIPIKSEQEEKIEYQKLKKLLEKGNETSALDFEK